MYSKFNLFIVDVRLIIPVEFKCESLMSYACIAIIINQTHLLTISPSKLSR